MDAMGSLGERGWGGEVGTVVEAGGGVQQECEQVSLMRRARRGRVMLSEVLGGKGD